jgi:hypothetical protein
VCEQRLKEQLHLPVTAYFEHLMPALLLLATCNPVTNVTAYAGGRVCDGDVHRAPAPASDRLV